MRKGAWLAAALACGPAIADDAAPARRSDLVALYHEAMANDPTFAIARLQRESAGEQPVQARAARLPNVSAQLAANENRLVVSHAGTPAGTQAGAASYWTWGPTLTATLPLYRPQLGDAVRQADLSVRQADAQLEQAREDLVVRVAQAYFDVLASEDALEALESNGRATGENLAQAKREFEVGTKTIVDTHEAQARADQIRAQQQVAAGDLVVKRDSLRAIVGHEPGALVPLRPAPELAAPQPADADAWAAQAEQRSPQVAAADAGAQVAHLEIERQKHAWQPTVDLQAQGSVERYDLGGGFPPGTQRFATIGVQLQVPIYTGGLIQSRIRGALADAERARQNLELARRNAALGARQAFVGATYGLSQVRALESAQVSAQSQLDSTKLGYKVGVRINLEVLDAETQLVNTQRDLKRARYDFLLNGLRLKSAVGGLTEDDLVAVNRLLDR